MTKPAQQLTDAKDLFRHSQNYKRVRDGVFTTRKSSSDRKKARTIGIWQQFSQAFSETGSMDYVAHRCLQNVTKPMPPSNLSKVSPRLLESFVGFVDEICDDIAYVKLTSDNGDILYGKYSAEALKKRGVEERQRFSCKTFDVNGRVLIEIERIPDYLPSQDEINDLNQRLEKLFGAD